MDWHRNSLNLDAVGTRAQTASTADEINDGTERACAVVDSTYSWSSSASVAGRRPWVTVLADTVCTVVKGVATVVVVCVAAAVNGVVQCSGECE